MERDALQVLNPERLRSLEEWLQKTSITLTQVNGQRKYGGPPPGWSGSVPGQGCEVFISHIPRDVYEDHLIPLFQSVALLYEFRLMMNFSGENRGFAYAKYADPSSAAAAVKALHMYPLQDGVKLVVRKSTEKRQLILSELPPNIGKKDLLMVLHMFTDGVENVTLKPSGPRGRDISALVHYSSHYTASMAKKVLVQAFKKQYGNSICVQWMHCNHKLRYEELCDERSPTPLGLKFLAKELPKPPRFLLPQPTQPNPKDPLPLSAPLSPHPLSRAVGGPVPQFWNEMLLQALRSGEEPSRNVVCQLQRLCELHGLSVTLYDVRPLYMSPDGFLHFTYRLGFTGMPAPLCGVVHILPDLNTQAMETELHSAIAQQVIKALGQSKICLISHHWFQRHVQ